MAQSTPKSFPTRGPAVLTSHWLRVAPEGVSLQLSACPEQSDRALGAGEGSHRCGWVLFPKAAGDSRVGLSGCGLRAPPLRGHQGRKNSE